MIIKQLISMLPIPQVDETNGANISVMKMDRQRQQQQQRLSVRQAVTTIQKMFALWCFPAWFSGTSSAVWSCGEHHTILLCPSRLLHSSSPHNSSLWAPTPRPPSPSQLPVPKHCAPAEHTHTVTGSGRTAPGHKQLVRPERAQTYSGCHAHESTCSHSHT